MNAEYFSVGATRRFERPNYEFMLTREQLEERWRLAQRCAKCPYPDDCYVCPYEIIEENPEIVEQFKAAHAEGMTDGLLGKKFGMVPKTAAAMRTVLGLEKNVYKRKKKQTIPAENPCEKCYSKEICKRHGGTCNERVRWEIEVGL